MLSQPKNVAKVYNWLKYDQCVLCQQQGICRFSICMECISEMPRLSSYCEVCGCDFPLSSGTCISCDYSSPYYDGFCSDYEFKFPLDRLIGRFKYKRSVFLAPFLAYLVFESVKKRYLCHEIPDCVVFVPSERGKLLSRGYSQVEMLGNYLVSWLGLPSTLHCLARRKGSIQQVTLGAEQRLENAQHAFELDQRVRKQIDYRRFRHVALLDDVMTTGATASACARLLKEAGAERVDVWCIARSSQKLVWGSSDADRALFSGERRSRRTNKR